MLKLSLRKSLLLTLVGALTLSSIGCSQTSETMISVSQAADPPPASPSPSPLPSPSTPPPATNFYDEAMNVSQGVDVVLNSASSRQDWKNAVGQITELINLLEQVPRSDANYVKARTALTKYQRQLTLAKLKSQPAPKAVCGQNTSPEYFFAPIKRRSAGSPVIEVTLGENNVKADMVLDTGASNSVITAPVAASLNRPIDNFKPVALADNSMTLVPIMPLSSIELDGRLVRNLPVGIMKTDSSSKNPTPGLLGQDFYEGYDVTINAHVVEFKRNGSPQLVTGNKKTPCLQETTPEEFSVPIKRRKYGLPIIDVTFNDKSRVEMFFDTGASSSVITRKVASQLKLLPVGQKKAVIADNSTVTVSTALVNSMKVNRRVKVNTEVSVPNALAVFQLDEKMPLKSKGIEWVDALNPPPTVTLDEWLKIISGNYQLYEAAFKKNEGDQEMKKTPKAILEDDGIGLLGQDFYQGYDVTIKANHIEFRLQKQQIQ